MSLHSSLHPVSFLKSSTLFSLSFLILLNRCVPVEMHLSQFLKNYCNIKHILPFKFFCTLLVLRYNCLLLLRDFHLDTCNSLLLALAWYPIAWCLLIWKNLRPATGEQLTMTVTFACFCCAQWICSLRNVVEEKGHSMHLSFCLGSVTRF